MGSLKPKPCAALERRKGDKVVAAGRYCLLAWWDENLCSSMPTAVAGIRLAPDLTGANLWSRCIVSNSFFISNWAVLLESREVIKVKELIVMAGCDRRQFQGKAGVTSPWFPNSSRTTQRGYFKIVLNCTKLQSDPVWLQDHWCHKATLTTPLWLHFTQNFWLAKKPNQTKQQKKKRKKQWKERRATK